MDGKEETGVSVSSGVSSSSNAFTQGPALSLPLPRGGVTAGERMERKAPTSSRFSNIASHPVPGVVSLRLVSFSHTRPAHTLSASFSLSLSLSPLPTAAAAEKKREKTPPLPFF